MDKIKVTLENIKKWFSLNTKIKISQKEKIIFWDQLSSLINSGIPLSNALKIVMYQTNSKRLKNILRKIIEDLNKWLWLKESISKYKKIFSNFDLAIVEIWETTWRLWNSLEKLRDNEEKNKELKAKIVWALIYPSIIITMSIIMIWVFMIFVIPKITDMYKDAKVNLPELTQNVINVSNFLQNNVKEIIIFITILIILIKILRNISFTKIFFDKLLLHIPIFWWLIRKKILSLFSSSLWMLLWNWIIINKSLEITSNTLWSNYYKKHIKSIIEWISKWEDLSKLMWIDNISSKNKDKYFPVELSSAVKIWEQTWKIPELLTKLSLKYNKEIDYSIKNIQAIIEPLVILSVWVIIWTLIMAIMLPFFNMVNVI